MSILGDASTSLIKSYSLLSRLNIHNMDLGLGPALKMIGKGFVLFKINSSPSVI